MHKLLYNIKQFFTEFGKINKLKAIITIKDIFT
jgi:hypothetical protein